MANRKTYLSLRTGRFLISKGGESMIYIIIILILLPIAICIDVAKRS